MVFVPEAFDYISENKEMCLSLAHSVDGPIIQDLSQTAKDLNVWLSLGFHEKVCNINFNGCKGRVPGPSFSYFCL